MARRNKIIYWIAILWLALGMLSTGVVQLLKVEEQIQPVINLGSRVFSDHSWCLENCRRYRAASSQTSFTEGMGLRWIFLCYVGRYIFARSLRSASDRNISFVVTADPYGDLVAFQTPG